MGTPHCKQRFAEYDKESAKPQCDGPSWKCSRTPPAEFEQRSQSFILYSMRFESGEVGRTDGNADISKKFNKSLKLLEPPQPQGGSYVVRSCQVACEDMSSSDSRRKAPYSPDSDFITTDSKPVSAL